MKEHSHSHSHSHIHLPHDMLAHHGTTGDPEISYLHEYDCSENYSHDHVHTHTHKEQETMSHTLSRAQLAETLAQTVRLLELRTLEADNTAKLLLGKMRALAVLEGHRNQCRKQLADAEETIESMEDQNARLAQEVYDLNGKLQAYQVAEEHADQRARNAGCNARTAYIKLADIAAIMEK